MADAYKLYSQCRRCMGTGIATTAEGSPENPCNGCNGVGFIETGHVEGADQIADLSTKLDEIKTKCNMIEADTNKIWAKVKDL